MEKTDMTENEEGRLSALPACQCLPPCVSSSTEWWVVCLHNVFGLECFDSAQTTDHIVAIWWLPGTIAEYSSATLCGGTLWSIESVIESRKTSKPEETLMQKTISANWLDSSSLKWRETAWTLMMKEDDCPLVMLGYFDGFLRYWLVVQQNDSCQNLIYGQS